MNKFLKDTINEIKNQEYISDIPIEEFNDIKELDEFVKFAKKEECGIVLHYETSNYHQGVVLQIFSRKKCTVKEYLDT